MRRNPLKRIIIICLALLLCLQSAAYADAPLRERYGHDSGGVAYEYNQSSKFDYYMNIAALYKEKNYKPAVSEDIVLPADSAKGDAQPELIETEGKTSFLWNTSINVLSWGFSIKTAGLYNVELDYYMTSDMNDDAVRMLYVDNKVPFYEANNLTFRPMWRENGKPRVNSLGDDVWPPQEQVLRWITQPLEDSNGLYDEPFSFYFEPGEHKITLEYVYGGMVTGELRVVPAAVLPTYEQYKKSTDGKSDAPAGTLLLQAEDIVSEKNDQSLRREYDADPLSIPQSMVNRRLNVIGGYRWRKGGQSQTLSFTAPADGLYKIGFRCLQTWSDGLPSYRRVKIDGQVPFKEFLSYQFSYSSKWQTVTFGDSEGNPYLFWFKGGETHTVTMDVTVAPFTDVIYSLNDDTLELSGMIRDITEITGSDPDPNYDYKLFRSIPTLEGRLRAIADSMQYKYDRVNSMAQKTPAMANNFLTIKAQMKAMIDDPFKIPRQMNDLNSALTSLGSWYQNIQSLPLMIDNFMVGSQTEVWEHKNSGFFSQVWAVLVNFVYSFFKDYDSVGSIVGDDTEIKDVINVWVAYGTEWAEQIKELADTKFTPESGYLVNINVLPSGQLNAGSVNALMLSITSGKAPDAAIGTSSTSPAEFAMRDATVDLSEFDDFPDVKKRFLPEIFVPYEYNNGKKTGTYGLPDTMNFNVMFYRKDIISDLNLRLPETRTDLYESVFPILYQNNMQFFFPADFSQFIFQNGADYYTEDGLRSALDTPEAFQAFKECSEIFTNYGVPVSADFFNRFRSGEMPMGISNYRLYMLFTAAAPELAGRWDIAPIPGTAKPDGTIDRSAGGLVAECSIILSQSQKHDKAWEFLKWWTSDETQKEFARNIESLVGVEARWNSANISAFENLRWGKGHLDVIGDYWKWAKEPPVVLGGYFTGRHLNNAWNRVIINGQPVRDALEEAVFDINRELRAKQEEYGIQ